MRKQFIKGNEAICKGAILAGCTHYYGYPITPSSEIVHTFAYIFPQIGGTFVQAESEIAAINMVYGAASTGRRVMTASSSPGISLKQEGVSYLAAAELPCVIVDIMRAGPGLGNIFPEQSDYTQVVKGGGHGGYRTPVLAPNSPQEMSDLTIKAFDLAEKYRTPVYILADGNIGQVMEPVIFPTEIKRPPRHDWAIYADKESKDNLISSIHMTTEELERVNLRLQDKYQKIEQNEVIFDEYKVDDADTILFAYGITSRIAMSAVDHLRTRGIKAGLMRPISLFPFPKERLQQLADQVKLITVLELSNGQMVDDVRLAVEGRAPVEFFGRMGGIIPEIEEVTDKVEELLKKSVL
jgi:2-oxoisovalerate ferredoxin oxidoreductase alpha subunit